MKKIFFFLFSALLICSCNTNPEQEQKGFSLTGTLKNIPDSTKVIISKGNIDLDSTLVMNEKFSFTGKVEEPYNVFLMLPSTMDYTTLWLENSDIELVAEKGKFEDRVITGSKIQQEDDILAAKIRPYRQVADSARAAIYGRTFTDAQRDSLDIFFNDLRRKEHRATQDFVRENPNSIVSSYILNFYKTTWGRKTTEELYPQLSEERKNSAHGIMISRYLEINKDPDVGDRFEDFAMTNANGEEVRLSRMKKKYTLLYFWAAHCYGSVQENPYLVQNYEIFKDRGFEILGVSIDEDRNTFLGSIKEHNLTWNNLMSPSGKDNDAALIYGINGTPDSFLIDEEGNIIARNLRGEELTQKLQELMPVKATAQL